MYMKKKLVLLITVKRVVTAAKSLVHFFYLHLLILSNYKKCIIYLGHVTKKEELTYLPNLIMEKLRKYRTGSIKFALLKPSVYSIGNQIYYLNK